MYFSIAKLSPFIQTIKLSLYFTFVCTIAEVDDPMDYFFAKLTSHVSAQKLNWPN